MSDNGFFVTYFQAFECENDEDPLEHLRAYLKIKRGIW